MISNKDARNFLINYSINSIFQLEILSSKHLYSLYPSDFPVMNPFNLAFYFTDIKQSFFLFFTNFYSSLFNFLSMV